MATISTTTTSISPAQTTTGLLSLPNEILASIVEALPSDKDLLRTKRTCKKLQDIADQHIPALGNSIMAKQYSRIQEQAYQLDFRGLDLVTALRQHAAWMVQIQAPVLPTEISAIFSDRYCTSKLYELYSAEEAIPEVESEEWQGLLNDVAALANQTLPWYPRIQRSFLPLFMPTITAEQIEAVLDADLETPFWPEPAVQDEDEEVYLSVEGAWKYRGALGVRMSDERVDGRAGHDGKCKKEEEEERRSLPAQEGKTLGAGGNGARERLL
ncbi:hypothetical protein LTR56_024353 [Elasticomyces elasticus]|nr:hypothetical protein LTR56_024353 [Elasticomyces elasticus]KAK3623191.1 hypothetical protein LTR22_024490 [Elasticomyces elasticus]KAK4905753.1 hypothetical protein LTR49_025002 [Elasticomyces elasticus]KAK5743205.1 hypothetical protein LTS12_023934 [Elasticomyces elasticus]